MFVSVWREILKVLPNKCSCHNVHRHGTVTCFQSPVVRELDVVNSMLGSDKKCQPVQYTTSKAGACDARPAVRPRPRTRAHHAAPAPLCGHARQLEASPARLRSRIRPPGARLLTPQASPQLGLLDQFLRGRCLQCRRFGS